MPELPEVETLRQAIEPCIVGRKIVDTAVLKPKIIARPQAETFCSALADCTITAMGRRGKFLTLQMDSGDTVILHLRMTGNLLAAPADWPREKHTHVVFSLSDGTQLRYVDSRGFGRFWLQTAGEQDDFSGMAKLGPEPFDPTFTAGYLQKSQQSRRRPIKECLLDQSVVAGIGNIYADEILGHRQHLRRRDPVCRRYLSHQPGQHAAPQRLAGHSGAHPADLAAGDKLQAPHRPAAPGGNR